MLLNRPVQPLRSLPPPVPDAATRESTPPSGARQPSTPPVSPQGSTSPPVPEPQVLLSQLVPVTDMSRFRRLRCPDWVWELAAGQPLPEFAQEIRFQSRTLLSARVGVPLTASQVNELLGHIRRGVLKVGGQLLPCPWQ